MKIYPKVDKIRYLDDERPLYPIDAIEISDERSNGHFITFYAEPVTKEVNDFIQSISDIMPNPGYHNDELFHLDPGAFKGWRTWAKAGGSHFHIEFEESVTYEDVKAFLERMEPFDIINPSLIEEVLDA